jgi:hypothetical protein
METHSHLGTVIKVVTYRNNTVNHYEVRRSSRIVQLSPPALA